MYSEYFNKRYGKYIEGYEKLEKKVFELENQHNKDQERIKELERELKESKSKSWFRD